MKNAITMAHQHHQLGPTLLPWPEMVVAREEQLIQVLGENMRHFEVLRGLELLYEKSGHSVLRLRLFIVFLFFLHKIIQLVHYW